VDDDVVNPRGTETVIVVKQDVSGGRLSFQGVCHYFGGEKDVAGSVSASRRLRSATLLARSTSIPTRLPSASKSRTAEPLGESLRIRPVEAREHPDPPAPPPFHGQGQRSTPFDERADSRLGDPGLAREVRPDRGVKECARAER
jgi:hypothetical protein